MYPVVTRVVNENLLVERVTKQSSSYTRERIHCSSTGAEGKACLCNGDTERDTERRSCDALAISTHQVMLSRTAAASPGYP